MPRQNTFCLNSFGSRVNLEKSLKFRIFFNHFAVFTVPNFLSFRFLITIFTLGVQVEECFDLSFSRKLSSVETKRLIRRQIKFCGIARHKNTADNPTSHLSFYLSICLSIYMSSICLSDISI